MKKVFKFLFGAAFLTAIAGGAYYIYKNYICKDSSDDFDDFDDDFEDSDTESEDTSESRDYIDIPVTEEKKAEEESSAE